MLWTVKLVFGIKKQSLIILEIWIVWLNLVFILSLPHFSAQCMHIFVSNNAFVIAGGKLEFKNGMKYLPDEHQFSEHLIVHLIYWEIVNKGNETPNIAIYLNNGGSRFNNSAEQVCFPLGLFIHPSLIFM